MRGWRKVVRELQFWILVILWLVITKVHHHSSNCGQDHVPRDLVSHEENDSSDNIIEMWLWWKLFPISIHLFIRHRYRMCMCFISVPVKIVNIFYIYYIVFVILYVTFLYSAASSSFNGFKNFLVETLCLMMLVWNRIYKNWEKGAFCHISPFQPVL